MELSNTFAVFSNVQNSKIKHSQYASLCLKDAIVDTFRDKYGKRPNIDTHYPDIWLNLFIDKNKATIGIETTGGSLHRRGYRKLSVDAPIQETIAASIIEMSGWKGEKKLFDPMCGSGTILCEALMKFCNIPAGYLRKKFGFEFLPDFDKKLWKKVKEDVDLQIRELYDNIIYGSDISEKSINITKTNANLLPGGNKIRLKKNDFRNLENINNSIIITNPPYGLRLSKNNVEVLMKEFGDFLKQKCKGSDAYIYFGNRELIKKIGLKPSWKKPLKNGGLDGRLVKFELY
jgi:putative N6-adenine-specific DNA methylase